jgi:enoyl-CoA hydratase/carnithine racemase
MVLPTWALVIVKSAVRFECRSEVMLEGRLFDADGAARVGFAHTVADEGGLDAAVAAATAELAALPTHAYAGNKKMLRREAAERAGSLVAAEMGAGFAKDA